MTAPARDQAAARAETEEHATATRTATKQPAKEKRATTGAQPTKTRSTKQAGGVQAAPKRTDKRRTRSAAAERAYARRDERRDQSRRPSSLRQGAEERRPIAARSRARQQLQDKVSTLARLPLVVVVMAVLATGLAATLWLSISAVSGTYQLKEADARINALNHQKEQLQREVSSMSSTPEIQRRAQQELGMVPAPLPAHLVSQPDGSVVVVGQPEAAAVPAPPAPPAPQAPAVVPGQPAPAPVQPAPNEQVAAQQPAQQPAPTDPAAGR